MRAHYLDTDKDIPPAVLGHEGITANTLSTDPAEYQGPIEALKERHGYIREDVVDMSSATPNLDALCAKFAAEHTHSEDEVRFVLDGEGYFDIRDHADRWMRVEVRTGDLLVIPARRHHRFLLTEAQRIRCVRLFKDPAGWVPAYRGATST